MMVQWYLGSVEEGMYIASVSIRIHAKRPLVSYPVII